MNNLNYACRSVRRTPALAEVLGCVWRGWAWVLLTVLPTMLPTVQNLLTIRDRACPRVPAGTSGWSGSRAV